MFSGMFVHSLLFFVCDLFRIPLNATSMYITLVAGALAMAPLWKSTLACLRHLRTVQPVNIRLYDLPVIGFSGYVFYMIIWASWYWPVTPFDAMAGIDLVAKYVVKDGTIVNSVFSNASLSGQLSNQPFYAPHAMLMQSIMKLLGFTYNQIWVGISSVAFSILIWAVLRQLAHPLIASILYLIFLLTPEMFGYTYLLQTDYINAVYTAIGVYLVWQGVEQKDRSHVLASIVFFAGACWSRTESPLLIVIGCSLGLFYMLRAFGRFDSLRLTLGIVGSSVVVFALWNVLFMNFYLPVRPSTSEQLQGFDVTKYLEVFQATFESVVMRFDLWGIVVWMFAVVIIASLLVYRRLTPAPLLLWIVSIILGLTVVGTVFSAAVVEQTIRRGMFKAIPLMVLAIAGSQLVTSASARLGAWESKRV